MKSVLKYHRLTILWALFILIICNVEFSLGPQGDSSLFFPGFDKLVHCGLFFVFAVFLSYGIIRKQNTGRYTYTTATVVFLATVIFGGLIEILQLTIFTWRNAEWNDLFADSVGTSMAVFSILITSGAINSNEKA